MFKFSRWRRIKQRKHHQRIKPDMILVDYAHRRKQQFLFLTLSGMKNYTLFPYTFFSKLIRVFLLLSIVKYLKFIASSKSITSTNSIFHVTMTKVVLQNIIEVHHTNIVEASSKLYQQLLFTDIHWSKTHDQNSYFSPVFICTMKFINLTLTCFGHCSSVSDNSLKK